MAEPRKIVLILGNGFDLDLGLKTSYKDFWESGFCPKDYPAPLIKHLNQCWPGSLDGVKWYDLENELLHYYNSRKNNLDYPDVISPELLDYVRNFNAYEYTCRAYSSIDEEMQELVKIGYGEFNKIPLWASIPLQEDFKHTQAWRDQKALQLIKDSLCNYLKSIDEPISASDTVAFHILLALSKSAEAGDFVNIYTFNFTRVQRRGYELKGIPVHYMHGNCENGNIIVGTRDDLEMVAEYDFLQKGMDDYFLPPDLVTALNISDEVIIFGHSLGTNDRQYFAPFFKRQASEDNPAKKDITIFTHNHESQREIKRALQQMTDGKLSSLFSINRPVIIKTSNIDEDQQSLLDFLVKHHTKKDYAEFVIGEWLTKRQSR